MTEAPSISLHDALADSSIRIAPHASPRTLDGMRAIVKGIFPDSVAHYCALGTDAYRNLVSEAQDALSGQDYMRKIAGEILPQLTAYLDGERFLLQTNLYLRATRPVAAQEVEAVGWHRETFYGANMERAVNIWTPVDGVDRGNTLRYVPLSQHIAEEDIVVERVDDAVTKRFSTGHKIGFVYAPKIITGGVALDQAVPMDVPAGSSSLFSGNLIHGSAANHGTSIRFSVDFRILPLSAWDTALSKSFHFASGKPYFEEY